MKLQRVEHDRASNTFTLFPFSLNYNSQVKKKCSSEITIQMLLLKDHRHRLHFSHSVWIFLFFSIGLGFHSPLAEYVTALNLPTYNQ